MGASLIPQLQRVVARQPAAPALSDGQGRVVDYQTLSRHAAALAAELRHRELGPTRLVGIGLPRSCEWVTAMLGVLWSGAAFLPLDPGLPDARLAAMIDEARPVVIVTGDEARFSRFGVPCAGTTPAPAWCEPASPRPDDLAYLIYTSGSSGGPKGVLVTHAGLVPVLCAQIEAFALTTESRTLWLLSPSFDASISDIGTTLLAGATLVVPEEDVLGRLLPTVAALGITHVDLPPSILPTIDDAALPASLRTIVIGGEVAPIASVRRLAGRVRLVNVYGPTEATICTSLCMCDPDWSYPLLGSPLPEVRYAVKDGELWIGGPSLARGYLDRPELTRARFVNDGDERWYRTGDRVVESARGLVFLGRLDRQLKHHGRLIAPEEIEAALAAHPRVTEAAVTLTGEDVLTACVVATGELSSGALQHHLQERLPRWMTPSRILFLAALPRTSSGKIDHVSLAASATPCASDPLLPARDERQTAVVAAWHRMWGRALLDDDFFSLGGDSMRVLLLVAEVGRAGVWLTPSLIAEHPRLGDLLEHLDDDDGMRTELLRDDVAAILRESDLLDENAAEIDAAASPREILLTGAAGFLGSRLLVELLERTEARVHCVVLARDDTHARQRLRAAVAGHAVHFEDERVECYAGDLSQPGCGLALHRWELLARSIDTVVHAAARVNFIWPYRVLRPSNVLGTREVARLSARYRRKRLHLISTLSVLAASDVPPPYEGIVHGGYAQSKWAAEWLVQELEQRLGPTVVHRLGLITGDTRSGYAPQTDWLTLFVRATVAVGCVPESGLGLRLELLPVDRVAAMLADRVARGGDPPAMTSQPQSLSLGGLVGALRELGFPVEAVDATTWRARLVSARLCGNALALCRCLEGDGAYGRLRSLDLFGATGGREGPAADSALVRTYLKYMLSS